MWNNYCYTFIFYEIVISTCYSTIIRQQKQTIHWYICTKILWKIDMRKRTLNIFVTCTCSCLKAHYKVSALHTNYLKSGLLFTFYWLCFKRQQQNWKKQDKAIIACLNKYLETHIKIRNVQPFNKLTKSSCL